MTKTLRRMRKPRRGWNVSIADFRNLELALAEFEGVVLPGEPTEQAVDHFSELAYDFGIDAPEATKRIARKFESTTTFEGVHTRLRTKYRELNEQRAPGTQSAANEDGFEGEEPSSYPANAFNGAEVPEQKWIVENMVPADDAIAMNGDGGVGKTTVALQLAVAKTTGKDWLGKPTGEAAPVMFFSGEERRDKIHARLNFIINGASSPYKGDDAVTWDDLANLHVLGFADRDALLAVQDKKTGRMTPTALYGYVDKKMAEHRPKLVIFDALYDIYGGDENARAPVRQFVSMLRRLCKRHECAIIVTGHPSLSGMASGSGTSGSTGWRNAFRSFLYLTTGKKKGPIKIHTLESKKQNYGTPDAVIETHWENGIFIPLSEDDEQRAAAADASKAEFLRLLDLYLNEGRSVSASAGPNYAPKVFADDTRATCGKKELTDAMNLLFGENKIVSRGYTKSDRKDGVRIERMEWAAVDSEFG